MGDGYAVHHVGYRATVSADEGQLRFTASNARAGLTLRTVGVGRLAASSTPSAPQKTTLVASETELLVPRGVAVEHWSATARGLEQSWSFAERPAGTGDLRVTVRIEGGKSMARQSEDGLHFDGVHYGLATWIDAAGRRTTIAPRLEDGSIRIDVPSSVIDSSSYPAVLDPLISPEFEIDAPIYGSREEQRSPAIAFDGTNSLVVWRECLATSSCQIVGTRVAQDGAILDNPELVLSPTFTVATSSPARTDPIGIAFDGTSYLVAWSVSSAIVGIRVRPDGTTVTTSPFTIATKTTAYNSYLSPAIAAGGGQFLVVWEASKGTSSQVHARLVVADGTVVGGVFGVTSTWDGSRPSIAHAGTTFLVAWNGNVRRVSDTGGLLALPVSLGTATNPVVATDGTDFFVAWPSASPLEVAGVRFEESGVQLMPSSIHIPITSGATALSSVSMTSTTSGYLLAWAETVNGASQISGARVNAIGDVLTSFSFSADPKAQQFPVLAAHPTGALVAWEAPNPSGSSRPIITARRLDTSGSALDAQPFAVSRTANRQAANTVTFDGTNYLAVWVDYRGNSGQLFGTRISPGGVTLDTPSLPLSNDPGGLVRVPHAASGGGISLVGWITQSDALKVIRVDGSGTILDPTPIEITPNASEEYQIAWNGQSFTVVWADHSQSFRLEGLRLGADGVAIDATPFVIMDYAPLLAMANINYAAWEPSLTCDGAGQCLVLWQDNRTQTSGSVGSVAVYGARLENGAVLDPSGFVVSIEPNQPGVFRPGTYATVTRANGNYVAAWLDASRGIVGTRISSAGALLDTAIPQLISGHRPPLLVSTGSDLLLVRETDPSTSGGITTVSLTSTRIDGQSGLTFGATDTLQTASAFTVPSAASNGQRQIFVLSAHTSPTQRVLRVYGQFVSFNTTVQGSACSLSSECVSGYCVDGVCCDSACGNDSGTDCVVCSIARGATADGTCTPLNAGSCFEGGSLCSPGTCSAGVCGNTAPVVCPPPAEQCHAAGICDPHTGYCDYASADDNTPCSDGDACTTVDVCTGGACVGGAPVQCAVLDSCHEVGVCDPVNGVCSNPVTEDGTACEVGLCQQGVCTTPETMDGGTDAGAPTDAGNMFDAGAPTDAGSQLDAGPEQHDGGAADASDVDAGPGVRTVTVPGCGCHGGLAAQAWWLGIGALSLIRRRRTNTASADGTSD